MVCQSVFQVQTQESKGHRLRGPLTPRVTLSSRGSPVLSSSKLVATSTTADARLGLYQWFARVPSQANLADGPSRLDFKESEASPWWERIELFRSSLERGWRELTIALEKKGGEIPFPNKAHVSSCTRLLQLNSQQLLAKTLAFVLQPPVVLVSPLCLRRKDILGTL